MGDDSKDVPQAEQVAIYYQNARHHRTVNADGVWVSLAPTGKVQFAVYNELRPMPEFVLHKISNEGLGEKLEEIVKTGVIRETQVSVIMDIPVVTQFIGLLQQMLSQLEAVKREAAAQAAPQSAETVNGN